MSHVATCFSQKHSFNEINPSHTDFHRISHKRKVSQSSWWHVGRPPSDLFLMMGLERVGVGGPDQTKEDGLSTIYYDEPTTVLLLQS
jgi:hypothetical protein